MNGERLRRSCHHRASFVNSMTAQPASSVSSAGPSALSSPRSTTEPPICCQSSPYASQVRESRTTRASGRHTFSRPPPTVTLHGKETSHSTLRSCRSHSTRRRNLAARFFERLPPAPTVATTSSQGYPLCTRARPISAQARDHGTVGGRRRASEGDGGASSWRPTCSRMAVSCRRATLGLLAHVGANRWRFSPFETACWQQPFCHVHTIGAGSSRDDRSLRR